MSDELSADELLKAAFGFHDALVAYAYALLYDSVADSFEQVQTPAQKAERGMRWASSKPATAVVSGGSPCSDRKK